MNILQDLTGITSFLSYFATSIGLTVLFLIIYGLVTPYNELTLIKSGNKAAVYSYGGALLGFVAPLASVISNSVSLVDMAIWGIVALLIQIVTFVAIRLVFPTIVYDIPQNSKAHGMFLGICSIAAGILNAACMTY